MQRLLDVIKKPVISEKSAALVEVANRYVFEVALEATKPEIKQAVEKAFGVRVRKIRTIVNHGKVKRVRRSVLKRPNTKKAILTLAEGQKIDIFQTK